ncbi:uncharacterized protein MKK02DRAFT_41058 [Dioszegia hungarica]|uniref:Uncharacterized protein n=1 Tax=Dioszegia hungarica TaxID=4972 RepID=A0AA38LTN4_9TREE|nr:uncharacterized protein MKK02DRAFT_41058 [Dioszegia hungarica]KAI9632746.1 hypothetical protein MKK02DRAFT_41058 [Dioszegia hungarica]
MFGRPSRSYAAVNHDQDGLSSVTNTAPYTSGSKRVEGGFKTYRPPLSETHGKRTIHSHDPNPNSAFAPLPPAFQLQLHRNKKDIARLGQAAELDRILDPDYKTTIPSHVHDGTNGESSSMGASRSNRGGSILSRHSNGNGTTGLGIKSTASLGNFKSAMNLGGKKGPVYMDGKGRMHDTEYDPFKGVSEASRKNSRRRSAFGSDRRHGSGSSSGSSAGSEAGDGTSEHATSAGGGGRKSVDGGREEEEARRRAELERRRLDELSGIAMARRRSMMSERSGRGTPSLRSSEDGGSMSTNPHEQGRYGAGLGTQRTRSQQGGIYYYTPSPLSPTFESGHTDSPLPVPDTPALSVTTSRARTNTTSDGGDDHPRKVTESTLAPPGTSSPPPPPPLSPFPRHKSPSMTREPTKEKIEIRSDGSKKITGFDAPSSPMPPSYPTSTTPLQQPNQALDVPLSAKSGQSRGSRGSSDREQYRDRERGDGESMISQARRPKPAERPREELFPETPAQAKKREERERRAGRTTSSARVPSSTRGLATDSPLTGTSTRLLPEIQIVADDDPRIVFNPSGAVTRVQTVHDHVIRGPFSLALQAQGQGLARIPSGGSRNGSRAGSPGPGGGAGEIGPDGFPIFGPGAGGGGGSRRPSSVKSTPFSLTGSARGSGVIEEGQGGYLPSRWANGDRRLRTTEESKEAYRPKEWGGKHGDLGGRQEEWKPDAKEQFKRQWKDMQTNARFSLFRAKKKLERKV